ncbi:hypothetical protein J1N09_00115 [Aureitalea sp. L0-47]|uniref:hypothetical protein n=1 Tax=Aureitalea sp. L0-47 TaxID=2816962 RepID=UPI002238C7A2|nr:hypothetical protein [Aureitalea sp. L0-47]MCW5518221.1 hypothetical protein [Aureitalea sp. L0-47]
MTKKNNDWRVGILAFAATCVIEIGIALLFFSDFLLSIIPGWHTTIYPPATIIAAIVIIAGLTILLYNSFKKIISKILNA